MAGVVKKPLMKAPQRTPRGFFHAAFLQPALLQSEQLAGALRQQ